VPASTRQVLDDVVGQVEELEGDLIDLEVFVIESNRERVRERERRRHLQVAPNRRS
jgi:hypothetical protein